MGRGFLDRLDRICSEMLSVDVRVPLIRPIPMVHTSWRFSGSAPVLATFLSPSPVATLYSALSRQTELTLLIMASLEIVEEP